MSKKEKKKKVDIEALQSPLMRIPNMDIVVARELIDIGIKEIYQLQGRSPEALLEDIKKRKLIPDPSRTIPFLRLAIYFAETDPNERDRHRLHPSVWQ